MRITRRQFLKVSGAAAAAGATVRLYPIAAFAQSGPVKIGVLAAKAGVTAPVGESGLRGTQWAVERVNAGGGILGRKVELVVEEESNPKDTVERFRKLVLQQKVDVVTGVISTGVGLAIGPAAEEEKRLLLMWDGTTQKGVEETMPKPRYAFRSVDNEAEAVMASILAARHFKGKVKTVAGINNDYSYGRDNWAAFLAITKKFGMNVTPVAELWPKLGETNFTSHVATLQQAKPDLVFCSFWSGDAPILLKQAHAAGLTASTKLVMTTAGGKWPTVEQVAEALEGLEVESLSGPRGYRPDHIMEATYFQGISTHKNKHDFVTLQSVEAMSTKQIQKPTGVGLYDWISSWNV
jgi:branched-chain amino acid transport system substrate-binding protein